MAEHTVEPQHLEHLASGIGTSAMSSSPTSGEALEKYMADVSSKYICPLCKMFLENPAQVPCGHNYCMSCVEWLLRNIPDPDCLLCGEKIVTDDAIFNFGSIKPDEVKSKEIARLTIKGLREGFLQSGPLDPYEEDPLTPNWNRRKHSFPKYFVSHPFALWFQRPVRDADVPYGVSSSLLQMAERADRVSPDGPGSSPDENEFPFGYPTSICENVPDHKYLCSSCNNVLKKAQQTLCGHRYCSACLSWVVRNNKNPICQKCNAEDPGTVNEGSLLTEERAFSDAAINKEISEFKVHCGIPGCSWSDIMKNFEDHQSLCEYALIPCHTGCGQMVMRKKLADHLENGCVNNMTTCQKCKRRLSSNEYQKHMCEGNSSKEQKRIHTEGPSKEKNHSTPLNSKNGCRFSEIGCSFRGSKEKTKEHEKTAVGTHLMMLLQHIKQLRASLCPAGGAANGIIPHLATAESKVKGLERKVSDLQLQGALEVSGDLEVDCFPSSSVCEEESILQRLVREKVISELENKLHVFENIVAVLNKEVETSNLEIAAFRRKSGLDQDVIQSLELKITELHRCLTQKDAGLSKLHKRLQSFEQASYDGVFLWKITDVNRKYHDSVTGRVVSLFSPAFYTAKYGYKVCLRIYLNGDGTGKGTHVSLFFVVMKGEYDALLPWPFKHKVTFMMLDQNNREHVIDAFRPDLTSASFQRPVSDMNVASGCPMFLPLCKLQSPKYAYVREDTLFLKCIIETNS
ncbi:TNF receptor-associated factor 1 isoform X1 [Terrapene carolina triunguis]|uniref:TNF receptor-associated factor 1 n=2 Tax=Terrapene triunguis TaxID=2587831 RepID=A0A674JDG5_9SAUR|nr:TNF receptor-associated factor 1 isoform X1 [Terrapene carolina triunguis]